MVSSPQEVIKALPHWARVAFAARCAVAVLPRFETAWPTAVDRLEQLRTAARLAEQSARDGRAAEGLERKIVECVMAAGASIQPLHNFIPRRTEPVGEGNCHIAFFAAKSAEWAAMAAQGAPSESVSAALAAYTYVRTTENDYGVANLSEQLDDDLLILFHAARRGRWTDRTPVPPTAFDPPPARPWWAFWR